MTRYVIPDILIAGQLITEADKMKLLLTIMALVLTVAYSIDQNKTMGTRLNNPTIAEQVNFGSNFR